MSKKLIYLISLFLVFALLGTNACLAGTIDVKIASGTDDAEEGPGSNGYYTNSSDLEMVDDAADNGGRQIIGLHFKNIGIPAGATITSAYIEFTCDELKSSSDPAYLLLSGHLTENPESFASGSALLSVRPLTVAQVSWEPESWTAADQKSKTADISSIIQELVDQAGWAAGNALEIIIKADTTKPAFTGVRVAESYDGEAADAALLHVEFEGDAVEPEEPTISGIWFEAENANDLVAPLETYYDDPCASGAGYMGVAAGNNSTSGSPAPDGTAHYYFDVPEAGTYKVFVRIKRGADSYNDDSAYARIDGATYSSGSDWIKWNNIAGYTNAEAWEWIAVFNNDDGDAQVEFTMDAGQYDLEIAYREDGLYFDAILITDDLALDPATLPDAIPSGSSCEEDNLLTNGSFEDGLAAPWQLENGSPTYEIIEGGEAQHGTKALKVTVDAAGGQQYQPALAHVGLVFEVGKKYTFSVFLKGSYDGMQVYLKPQDRGGSWTGYGAEYKTLTTEWAEYSVTTPEFASVEAYDHDVSIWLGMQAGDVYIDHARFYEGDYVAPCPPEGPPPAIVKATKPMPANNTTDLTRFNMLSWTPGDYADSHNVYFGTNKQAVTDATIEDSMGVLISQQQVDAFIDTAGDYGTTYYWRVDEVNEADMTIYPGSVWKFSTAPIGLIIPQASITATASSQKDDEQGPEKTIDGSGLTGDLHGSTSSTMWLSASTTEPNKAWIRYDFDQVYKMPRMLIWNHNLSGLSSGYAIKGVTIEYSEDGGETWIVLPDPNELEKGTGLDLEPAIVDLGGVADGLAINAIRITAESNYRSSFKQYGLSEVRFYYVPVRPKNPSPADDATDVSVKPTLTWEPGDGVVEHKVFFGTNEQAVIDGTADSFVVANPSFNAPELTLGTEYFWRVEEVNMASTPTEWSGETWSFTTGEYTVVDDFESYNNSINKWSGGNSYSGNGAAIDLASGDLIRGKSMIFMFDNTSTEGYSEVSVNPGQLNSGSKWTVGSPTSLVFWIYGDPSNIKTERLYVKLNDAVYWNRSELVSVNELVTPWWTQVTVPLDGTAVNLNNVNSLKIGFIRTAANTGSGQIKIDDIRLYKTAPSVVPVNPGDANLVARYKMENNVNDSSGNGFNGVSTGEPNFVSSSYPGFNKALEFDGTDDFADLPIGEAIAEMNDITISTWVKWDGGNIWQRICDFGSDTNNYIFMSPDINSHKIRMAIKVNGQEQTTDAPFGLPAGEWHHVVGIIDSSIMTMSIYVDSELVAANTVTHVPSDIGVTTQNYLGKSQWPDPLLQGALDEFRVYNKVLSDGEIKFLSDPTP